jgi:hypothetical protein
MPFAFAASQLAGSLPSRLQIDLPRLARAIGVTETIHYDQHIAKPLIYAASDLAALRTDDDRQLPLPPVPCEFNTMPNLTLMRETASARHLPCRFDCYVGALREYPWSAWTAVVAIIAGSPCG